LLFLCVLCVNALEFNGLVPLRKREKQVKGVDTECTEKAKEFTEKISANGNQESK
jgi:hypothetical protein